MLITLLSDFWKDLHEGRVWWQIGVVGLCVIMSLGISQFFHRRILVQVDSSKEKQLVSQLFVNMMFPILMLAFLFLGKVALFKWQHVYLLSLLIPVYGALALIRFGSYLSRRLFAENEEISALHLFIEKSFTWGVWLVAILYYTGFLQNIVAFMDENVITIGRTKLSIADILQELVSVIVAILLALWVSAAVDERLMKVESLHSSLRMVLSRLSRSLLIIIAIIISLNLVGIDLTVFSIFSGALGVGLGFGLQKIASNYVSGFIILLDRSLSIDDMITVDKYSGRVSEINSRYTVLKGLDGVESVIPNEMLVSSPVQNLSLTDREILMSTDVTVGFNTDIEALLPMLMEAASRVERVSTKLLPSAYLMNFGANGLELRLVFWINDPENGKTGVLSSVNREIWKLLKEQHIEIPYPQREVTIIENISK